MKSSYIVMNNNFIRKIICSYLRKKPKIKCKKCNLVCVWDKEINEYVEFNFYPWNMYGSTLCKKCFSDINSVNMNILHSPNCIIV